MTEVRVLTGAALEAALPQVAQLRIAVFRDWPYLYAGDLAHEAQYLQSYRDSDRAILVGAFDGARMIGAATGTPLADHADAAQIAGCGLGVPVERIFYCAESVLLPGYRGHGIGHLFFDQREAFARARGFTHAAFCAVRRPADHPQRPADYRPLDPFWRKRGYAPVEGAEAVFSWKDLGGDRQSEKPLQVWMRAL
ncbi:MAG: N-acetyltransferase [Rhodobacteraceae bacterium]|nr:MAG: N-acetyltransferase [Paracoccaceae bacterium]